MLTDIKSVLQELNDVLGSLIEEHHKLADTSLLLRKALVDCDHEAIEKQGRANERISADIRQLENRRLAILRETELFDEPADSFSAIESALSERELKPDEKSELEKTARLREELASIIHKVDHENQLNLTLVGQALGFHDLCLQLLLNSSGSNSAGYSRPGSSNAGDGAGFVDGIA